MAVFVRMVSTRSPARAHPVGKARRVCMHWCVPQRRYSSQTRHQGRQGARHAMTGVSRTPARQSVSHVHQGMRVWAGSARSVRRGKSQLPTARPARRVELGVRVWTASARSVCLGLSLTPRAHSVATARSASLGPLVQRTSTTVVGVVTVLTVSL